MSKNNATVYTVTLILSWERATTMLRRSVTCRASVIWNEIRRKIHAREMHDMLLLKKLIKQKIDHIIIIFYYYYWSITQIVAN